jgi:hypothetical protein
MKCSRLSRKIVRKAHPNRMKYYTFMSDPEHSDFEVMVEAPTLGAAYKKLFAEKGLRKGDVVLDEVATLKGKITARERKLAREVF